MRLISIGEIHKEFVPKYDRWEGRLGPRIISWLSHMAEIPALWFAGNRLYSKHVSSAETCRQHAAVEFGDWLWLTAEIFWMLTEIELPIVPQNTLERVWNKMERNRTAAKNIL